MAESFPPYLARAPEAESRLTLKYSDARRSRRTQFADMGLNSEPAREGEAKGAGRVDYPAACGLPPPAASIATATDCTIAAKRTAV